MRQARITTAAAAGFAAVALVATGCSAGGGDAVTEEPATVHLALNQDVGTLLPMDSNVDDNIAVLDVVYDGLVRYDPETTEPYNYVAEEISTEDNTVWTITIKPDLTFQNGEPVDAASFARAWNYAAYGPNAMANNYFFERFVGYDEMQGETDDAGVVTVEPTATELSGVTVVDDHTLEVTLNGPFAGFSTMLGYTGFFPVAEACLEDVEACAVKPIGNGPFQVDEWVQGEKVTASKWADYPLDEAPAFDAVEWTEFAGGSSWADFMAGNLDEGAPGAADLGDVESDPDLAERVVERPGAALTYIGFPLYLSEPWTNIELRKAISMAIDREGIIEAIVPGERVPADSWVVPGGVPGGETGTCEFCTFDPEAAKEALAAAGGWPSGQTLTITAGTDEEEAELFKAIGDSIQETLGVPYELETTEDFSSKRRNREMTGIFRNNWFPDYPVNENYLAPVYASGDPEEGNTNFGYYGAEFEEAIEAGDSAETLEDAVAEYQKAEAALAADFPTVPLWFSVSRSYHSERLSNVILDPFSGQMKLRPLEVAAE
ncbi:peptide ABC transporter substrate-binding protein [Antribacter gilvus]|uniref:peptide ABC transporter substrate-binding protein n=1 Tax=Antribacter gilvus TaxID=2304675 RepID=UPI0013E09394|nr:ABC transporter substrate-binding protein [Antribacter gilvus]